nr:hypothetical protein [Tanacetum cinerariifolium]
IYEDYHSIKDDIPLVSVYTTGNVLVQGMLILDEFLTEEICATDDFKEYETVFVGVDVPMNQPKPSSREEEEKNYGESSSPHKSLKVTIRQKQMVAGEKDDDDSKDRIYEDYHSIKDDIPLVSVYTTGNVLVQGMLILDEFLTEEICATDDFKEYETVFVGVDVPMNQPKPVVSTQ